VSSVAGLQETEKLDKQFLNLSNVNFNLPKMILEVSRIHQIVSLEEGFYAGARTA